MHESRNYLKIVIEVVGVFLFILFNIICYLRLFLIIGRL